VEIRGHLARQQRDRSQAQEVRGVALMAAAGPLAIAEEERVLRLRAGAVGPTLRVTAEAPESVGAAGRTSVNAAEPRGEPDRLAVRAPAAPPVLRAKRVSEELVAHDEEGVDAQVAAIEGGVGERGVLDQLTGVVRVEDAVEVLAAAEIDRLAELLEQDQIVGHRGVIRGDARDPGGRHVAGRVPRGRCDRADHEHEPREKTSAGRGPPLPREAKTWASRPLHDDPMLPDERASAPARFAYAPLPRARCGRPWQVVVHLG